MHDSPNTLADAWLVAQYKTFFEYYKGHAVHYLVSPASDLVCQEHQTHITNFYLQLWYIV